MCNVTLVCLRSNTNLFLFCVVYVSVACISSLDAIICRPKDQGGLGTEVLDIKNRCLLSKWLFKLLSEEGVWQELLHNKYLRGKTLSQVQAKPTDSPFWKGLMGVKSDFF